MKKVATPDYILNNAQNLVTALRDREVLSELKNLNKKENIEDIFYLDLYHNRADFYIDEKRKIEFLNLKRPSIIKLLYENKGKEVTTEAINNYLHGKIDNYSGKTKLSKHITEIKRLIKNNFKIDPERILPNGVPGSGYKIGKITILITKK
jgi:hypothetical protein